MDEPAVENTEVQQPEQVVMEGNESCPQGIPGSPSATVIYFLNRAVLGLLLYIDPVYPVMY